jgi:alkylresorcinol/alkylpyrone synthase
MVDISMYLESLSTAVPPLSFTPTECWDALQQSTVPDKLSKFSMRILRRMLLGNTGIEKRHFAIDSLEKIFALDAEQLNRYYERSAPPLGGTALEKALIEAHSSAQELDALFVCSCTGYLCPGVSSYIAESIGLRSDAYLIDIVGLGCGAAIPTLKSAQTYLAAHPDAKVGVVAVEVCSAAFYLEDDPGILISACIFGDGAAAAILSNNASNSLGCFADFQRVHLPESREALRFRNSGGKLANILTPAVPEIAASATEQLFRKTSPTASPQRIIAHAGGKDIIHAIENQLPQYPLSNTRHVFQNYGNMSSPSVLFALNHALKNNQATGNNWLISFGAGFSAHSCCLTSK